MAVEDNGAGPYIYEEPVPDQGTLLTGDIPDFTDEPITYKPITYEPEVPEEPPVVPPLV